MRAISILILGIFALSSATLVSGQTSAATPPKYDAEIALAKLALAAHGGDKLKNMKSLVLRGSVDVTTSAINQAIPATFVMVLAGEKYRLELMNPFQPIKQVFDGVNTTTTIQSGWTLPPINRIGLPLLQMIGESGFVITPLPAEKKNKNGFRMTSPQGFYTDFYLDEKTNRIKGYDAGGFEIRGRKVTTSVEIDKMRLVDGVVAPERYAQRFEMEQVVVYADFKVKEILVNSELDADVFSTGK